MLEANKIASECAKRKSIEKKMENPVEAESQVVQTEQPRHKVDRPKKVTTGNKIVICNSSNRVL